MPDAIRTSLKSKPSGTTEKGRERVQEILDAARRLFAAEGYAGLSMRRVAAAVGMSLGNVQHYYQSKDLLVEAVLLYTMNAFQAKIDEIVRNNAGLSRAVQLQTAVDMVLGKLNDPVIRGVFFEIWALAERNPFASALMDRMLVRQRKAIYKLIQGMAPAIPDEVAMQRAILIIAQVEGIMLFRLHRNAGGDELAAVHAAVRKAVMNLATVP